MSKMFTNFLSDFAGGLFADSGYLRDYQHASRLYVDSAYGMAPKAGWSYFVEIGLNPAMAQGQSGAFKALDETWYKKTRGKLGLVAKTCDLPRFSIGHETLNQYNKKTVIQNKITYNPINIVFHDDMNNMTTNLWKNYYQYYYSDSRYQTAISGGLTAGRTASLPEAYAPFSVVDATSGMGSGGALTPARGYSYGLNNLQTVPFFSFIRIFLLNRRTYNSITLINPMITEWSHSQLDNSGSKMLENKMTIAYEAVYYDTNNNKVTKGQPGFNEVHYDQTRSPLRAGKAGGLGGLLGGAGDLMGSIGDGLENGFTVGSLIGMAKQSKDLVNNYKAVRKDIKKNGGQALKSELYSIGASTFSDAARGTGAYEDTGGLRNVTDKQFAIPGLTSRMNNGRGLVPLDEAKPSDVK
jgi:hypothetical protein